MPLARNDVEDELFEKKYLGRIVKNFMPDIVERVEKHDAKITSKNTTAKSISQDD